MPRGDRTLWGGARYRARPDAKRRGPKPLAVVKLRADDAIAFLRWLEDNAPNAEHPARRGWEQAIAALDAAEGE